MNDMENELRLAQLERMCLNGRQEQAARLAFEWVKTGVFRLREFTLFVEFCLRAGPV